MRRTPRDGSRTGHGRFTQVELLKLQKIGQFPESTKRKRKTKYICECRCYERLKAKTKEFTCLSYTELVLELEHVKIETRLITEMFANVRVSVRIRCDRFPI